MDDKVFRVIFGILSVIAILVGRVFARRAAEVAKGAVARSGY